MLVISTPAIRRLLALLVCLGMPASASAQPAGGYPVAGQSLPYVATDHPLAGVRLAQSTEAVSRPELATPPVALPSGPAERGLFQGMNLLADWVPRLEDDSLGRTTFSASASVGVPPFVLGVPVLITPRAALHLVDGPNGADVPARLNDFELSFGTFKKFNERWTARGSVNVGVYGDDHSLGASDALRVSGFGVALYKASDRLQWAFGAAYLNRDDISVVPAVGLIYDPGGVRYELLMPRPRIVWELPQNVEGHERTVYLAGDLGGGAWAVRRADGTTDTLNLSRWGLLLGYETKAPKGSFAGTKRYEFGYVFGRDLEFANSGEEFSLDDSVLARVGWSY